MVRQMLNIRVIKPNSTCAVAQAWGQEEFHGLVDELCDRTEMTSKCLKQPPSQLRSPRGRSVRHHSSPQSRGQQPHPLVGVHLWVGGNDTSLHAVEGFQMGRIGFCIEREFSD